MLAAASSTSNNSSKTVADDLFNIDFTTTTSSVNTQPNGNYNTNNNNNNTNGNRASDDLLMLNGSNNPFLQNLVSQSYNTASTVATAPNPFQAPLYAATPNSMLVNTTANPKLGKKKN